MKGYAAALQLSLKMKERVLNQGKTASRTWKRQEGEFSPSAS